MGRFRLACSRSTLLQRRSETAWSNFDENPASQKQEGKTTQQRNENRTATLRERQTGTWELEKPQQEMPGCSARQWTSEKG
ncbi:hypothetical protein QQF64_005547 [Cirrhinus molitorella]|uniref:Uncharacterized protein n=1 Tax=Cirrhinus molitorella TaxID=172907 RepID=A0ABR3MCM4_9TELE